MTDRVGGRVPVPVPVEALEVGVPVATVRRALGRGTAIACFPGVCAEPGGRGFQQDLDLPWLGRRRQRLAVSVAVGRGGAGSRVSVRADGEWLSWRGEWRLYPAGSGVRAELAAAYEVSPALAREAVDALRRLGPLPFRSDADAILTRAVRDAFHARFSEAFAAYRDQLRDFLAGPGTPGRRRGAAGRPEAPAARARPRPAPPGRATTGAARIGPARRRRGQPGGGGARRPGPAG